MNKTESGKAKVT